MNLNELYRPAPPWILLHAPSEAERQWLETFLYKMEGCSPVIRTLRGKKMSTRQGLMDEFGAALQFFEDFGENWYALRDCLRYMDEWLPGEAYILVITKPLALLAQEPAEELQWFLRTIKEVGEWWSKPITDNDRFNRGAIPFHVVFRCDKDEISLARQRFGEIQAL